MTKPTALTPAVVAAQMADQTREWYALTNINGEAVLRIYEPIDDWCGLSASQLAEDLDKIDAEQIRVEINSPGGNVFDGIAIYNALRAHPARVTTRVDGLAASIASVIFQAGDERQIMTGAQVMIHNAWTVAVGDSAELHKTADLLEKQNVNIADIYTERSGSDLEASDWLDLMSDETWMTAAEAVEYGLADTILSSEPEPEADNTTAQAKTSGASPKATGPDPVVSLALLELSSPVTPKEGT